MRRSGSSASVPADAELLLPRAPGVIRQFWARHPLLTDIMVTLFGLLIAITASGSSTSGVGDAAASAAVHILDVVSTVLALIAALALMVRRRWPLIPFSLTVLLEIVLLGVPDATGAALLALPMYAIAVYMSTRACWIAYGSAVGAIVLVGGLGILTGTLLISSVLNSLIGTAVMGLLGSLIGINVGNRKRYLEAVIDRSRQLMIERDQQAQLAAAAERSRIAREMHDIVSHSLTVIVALSDGASATPDIQRARDAMDAAAGTAREALTEMRTMLGLLRDADSDADAPLTPVAPVSPVDVAAAAQRAGYPVTISVTGDVVQADPLRFAVGRIVQEGVTNAMRHAPGATSIAVTIEYTDTSVTVRVRNDGAPARADSGGFGLRGLRERVAQVGGTMTAGPDGGGIWLLTATLPVQDEHASGQGGGIDDTKDDA